MCRSSSSKKKISRCVDKGRAKEGGGEVGEEKNMEENMEVKYGGKYGRKPPSAWNWRGGGSAIFAYFFAIFWGDRQKYGGKYGGLALEILGLIM